MKLVVRVGRNWRVYVFLLLPVTYLLVFCYYPMLGVNIAFRDYSIQHGIWGSPWVGFSQFIKFFESPMFFRVVKNTLTLSLYSLVAGFPVPIVFALLLNSVGAARFRKFVQTLTSLPHFISTVVLVGIIIQVLNPRIGAYGAICSALTGDYPPDVLGKAAAFPHLYVLSGIWQQFGWGAIIYLAALSAVSTELHEAAQIDGASRFQRLLHIDFPGILPTATIMLILRFGQIMRVGYEKTYLMQNSLNLSSSEIISTYVYKVGLASNGLPNYSYSTAIGLFNSVINLILITLVNQLSRRMSETSLW